MQVRLRRWQALLTGVVLLGGSASVALSASDGVGSALKLSSNGLDAAISQTDLVVSSTASASTATPIKHVVVIFDENASFDHYFGTYPAATNTDGEPFYADPGTPSVTGLNQPSPKGSGTLLTNNPNATNPVRLDPTQVNQVLTCDQNHGYTAEENAFDGGKMDNFEGATGTATSTGTSPTGLACAAPLVMDYYDGNTVTALWNYAQHFAMSDDNFGTTYGPSTEGAVNVISGDTGGVDTAHAVRGALTDGDTVSYTNTDGSNGTSVIADASPYWDDCATGADVALNGTNIGDQLNSADLSWGWFQGGFTPNSPYSGPVSTGSNYNQLNNPDAVKCSSASNVGSALGGTGTTGAHAYGTDANYSSHYDGFQFYSSTANPHHLAPTSLSVVGTDTATPGEFDTANHNYDVSEFNELVSSIQDGSLAANHFPAVSYLKAPVYETGHPATSDPIDEQVWLVNEINAIEALPTWKSTAIFITYDDSDGWYDGAYSAVTNPSVTSADTLTSPGVCGPAEVEGVTPLFNEQGRCGYGPRLPMVVISPYAKQDYVSSQLTDQSSIVAFIEQNWGLGEIPGSAANIAGSVDDLFNFTQPASQLAQPLYLSPTTGEPSYPVEGTISPTSGPHAGGTSVTISGMNFSTTPGGTTVKFGTKASTSVTCAASTTLQAPATTCTAIAPPGTAGAGVQVTVKVGGTPSVDDAGDYTYTS